MQQYKNIRRTFHVECNEKIGPRTYMMKLRGDTSLFGHPGQFVNVGVWGKFLRRPISVCDYDAFGLTLLYDVVGEGTSDMTHWSEGWPVDLLVALGNGFEPANSGDRPLLLGGGIGIAPLYGLAKEFVSRGVTPIVVLGFNTGADVVWLDKFSDVCPTYVATVDGTEPAPSDACVKPMVTKGFVTDVIRERSLEDATYFYACGPLPMLRALCEQLTIPGEVSMESRMGCGFGICMCCSLETTKGSRRICKEGPVFRKEELIWK